MHRREHLLISPSYLSSLLAREWRSPLATSGGDGKARRALMGIHERDQSAGGTSIGTEPDIEKIQRRRILKVTGTVLSALVACPRIVCAQDKSGFPEGYDAVQAAPNSHRVIFENALVRVLEVILPPPGATEPMHHHRWPSFFLAWDRGGKTPHVRYLRPNGSVRDEPSADQPVHAGRWSVQWMKPEPMHAIQVVDKPERPATDPPLLRIEIKGRSQER